MPDHDDDLAEAHALLRAHMTERRVKMVLSRASADERTRWQAMADQAGLTLSDWLGGAVGKAANA